MITNKINVHLKKKKSCAPTNHFFFNNVINRETAKYTFFIKIVSKEKWNAVKELVGMVRGLKEEGEKTAQRSTSGKARASYII